MPLGCLVRHLGTLKILEWYPTMPQELLAVFGDQTLAPYVSSIKSIASMCKHYFAYVPIHLP